MSLNALQSLPFSGAKMDAKTDIYTNLNGLQNLKTSARKDSQAALPEVARQFEAVMISMMIKNMRKTGLEDPIFKSQAMDSYRDMYDQQLSMELSKGQGIGLAKAIAEQLQYQAGQKMSESTAERLTAMQLPERRAFPNLNVPITHLMNSSPPEQLSNIAEFASPDHFVKKLWPLAEQAAEKLGTAPEVILSQAALETGWGKYVISSGQKSSFNLFNIKADRHWQGERMEKWSIEFLQNKSLQQKSDFRVYNSYEQSFEDYIHFLMNNPRYKNVLEKTAKEEQSLHDYSYIKALQQAGYATDPAYSNKIMRVLKSEPIQNQILSQTKLASK